MSQASRDYGAIVRPLLFADISSDDVAYLIDTQLAAANLTSPPSELQGRSSDYEYHDNRSLWQALISERVHANSRLILREFFVSEWFPRSPGLFHTPRAEHMRRDALHYLLPSSSIAPPPPSGATAESDLTSLVFNPYGKLSMLRGGIGCFRLRDTTTPELGATWFMSASSTPAAHEGMPIALASTTYDRWIDEIRTRGAARCTVVGTLRFLPQRLTALFGESVGIPQVYVLVDDLLPESREVSSELSFRATAAVSFLSSYEGYARLYATYVTFFPGTRNSLQDRIEWLDSEYVRGAYRGEVVTDFDEQMTRFKGAVFSLHRVMTGALDESQIAEYTRVTHNYFLFGKGAILVSENRQILSNSTVYGNVTNQQIGQRIHSSWEGFKGAGAQANSVEQSIQALHEEVKKLAEHLVANQDGGAAQEVIDNLETFTEEASKKIPRIGSMRSAGQALIRAATTVAQFAGPIANAVNAVLQAFGASPTPGPA